MFPGTNPKGIKARRIPICDGDRPYNFAATNGAPTKNIPNIEKLNAETKVGGQNFIDESSNGYDLIWVEMLVDLLKFVSLRSKIISKKIKNPSIVRKLKICIEPK